MTGAYLFFLPQQMEKKLKRQPLFQVLPLIKSVCVISSENYHIALSTMIGNLGHNPHYSLSWNYLSKLWDVTEQSMVIVNSITEWE